MQNSPKNLMNIVESFKLILKTYELINILVKKYRAVNIQKKIFYNNKYTNKSPEKIEYTF